MRELDQVRFAVVLNFSSRRTAARIGEDLGAHAAVALSTHTARPASERIDLRKLVLEPDEGVILRLEQRS